MSAPAIDFDDARAFIAALTGSGDSAVTFQTFTDPLPKPTPDPLARWRHGTLDQHKRELVALNNRGAGIFLMVNQGDGKGRSAENVVGLTAFFTDNDGTAPRTPALHPSFTVNSAHGPHNYWKLAPGADVAAFPAVQKQLAAYYGTDPSVHDLPRVMRVPGFFHRKGEPFLVTFRPASGRVYDLGQIVAAHPVPAVPQAATAPKANADAVRREKLLGIVRTAAAGRPWTETNRHASAKTTTVHARKLGLDDADTTAVVAEFLVRSGKTAQEADDIVRWAFDHVAPDPGEQRDPTNVVSIGVPQDVRLEEILPEPEHWPDPIDPAAYHGILGQLARVIEPHTEADPIAVLIHNIIMFGSAVGHQPHFRIGATKHHTVENAVLVGVTSKARKGTAENEARRPYQIIEDSWIGRVTSGLSTGEGLLSAVRDALEKQEPIREGKGRKGKIIGYETIVADEGVADKRHLAIESEWGRVLRVMERDGSTLSSVLRQMYDCPHVAEIKTRVNPIRATDPHVSILGHITRDELLRYLDRTDQANGFANRFLYALVRRSRELPNGGNLSDEDVRPLAVRLRLALADAREVGRMTRTPEAQAVWEAVYSPLSRGRDGIVGGVTNRAEAHVLRLSMIYALADGKPIIDVQHLDAALALWTYCEDSAEAIFGANLGNPDADEILRNLRISPGGMTRTDLHGCFGRNLPEHRLTQALDLLNRRGLARGQREIVSNAKGRPTERWFAARSGARINDLDEVNAPSAPPAPPSEGLNSSNSFNRAPGQKECVS